MPTLENFRHRFRIYKIALWAGLIVMFGGPILANQLGSPLSSAAVLVPLLLGCLLTCGTLLALVTDLSYSTAPPGRRWAGAAAALVFTLLLTGALIGLMEWLVF